MWSSSKRHRFSIATTARWETPYIAEWLSYHRAIGFDHVYLYCNDDEPDELFTAVSPWCDGAAPFVTFIHCPHQGQQWWMHVNFLERFRAETEWVAFLDVDEFLSLRRSEHLSEFVRRRPGVDCIYFWPSSEIPGTLSAQAEAC